MDSVETVKTVQPVAVVNRFIADLRRSLTAREQNKYRNVFFAAFTQSLMGDIFRNFLIRSHGVPDEMGYQWQALAPSTIKRKSRDMNPRLIGQLETYTPKGPSTWSQDEANFFSVMLEGGLSNVAAANKARHLSVRKKVKTKNPFVPIGIQTGRLAQSLRPGTVVGGRYYAPKEQVFTRTEAGVDIGSAVDYAEYFHALRRLWPKNPQTWLVRAVQAGLYAVRQLAISEIR